MEEHDEKMIRCPSVGDMLNFRYCRLENSRLPCRRIASCWQSRMDIEGFLTDHYTAEELAQVFAPPKPKIQRLVELAEKAKGEGPRDASSRGGHPVSPN